MVLPSNGALKYCPARESDRAVTAQVAQGMSAVAAAGIIHRDLAARNVLVFLDRPPHVKVADFGLGRLSANGQSVVGTHAGVVPVRWAPIEAISGRRKWQLELSDVWSFAVLLWEIYLLGFVSYNMTQTNGERRHTDAHSN